MSTTTFGIQPSDLHPDGPLAFVQDVRVATLERAIQDAAGDVREALLAGGMDPDAIDTDAALTNDRQWCAKTVKAGAAAYYGQHTSGSDHGLQGYAQAFADRLRDLRENPNHMRAYQARTGLNAVRTHTTDEQGLAAVGMGRMASPVSGHRWEP